MLNKILIASNNKGKIKEFTEILNPMGIEVISTSGMPYPEPEEYGKTFAENALIKARYYADRTGIASLSDDSGLEVHSLNNAPGIYSARYAKNQDGITDFNYGMQKLEAELNNIGVETRAIVSCSDAPKFLPSPRNLANKFTQISSPLPLAGEGKGEGILYENSIENYHSQNQEKLTANFTCSLCLALPNLTNIITEGKVFGTLQFPPKGEKGFGYDAIFIADGYTKTFAEIDPAEKHAISHRAIAFKQMIEFINR